MSKLLLPLQIILLLCVFISVIESSRIEKRDVHRIILKNRRPIRSHHSHHSHHKRRPRRGHRGHKYAYDHYRDSFEEGASFEASDDVSRYNSRENSFEENSSFRDYSHRNHHYRPYSDHRNKYSYNSIDNDSQQQPDWHSLLESETKRPHKYNRRKKRNRPHKKHRHYQKSQLYKIELTTPYPRDSPVPPLYDSDDFTVMGPTYSDETNNHKNNDYNNLPPIIKNLRGMGRSQRQIPKNKSYEVREVVNDDLFEGDLGTVGIHNSPASLEKVGTKFVAKALASLNEERKLEGKKGRKHDRMRQARGKNKFSI